MFIFSILNRLKLIRYVSSIAVLVLISASAVVLSSCGDDDEDHSELTIGYMGDHAGWADTEEIGNMAALAIDHINEAGGVGGMPVRLIRVNAPETTAAEDARGLIADGASAVVGPSRSDVVAQIAGPVPGVEPEAGAEPVARMEEVPFISPGSTRTNLRHAEDGDFMFRLALPDSVQGKVLADLISGDDINEVSILYNEKDSYSKGLKDDFTKSYAGTVVDTNTLIGNEACEENYSGDDVCEYTVDEFAGGKALVVVEFPATVTDALKGIIVAKKFERYYFADTGKSASFLGELKMHADDQGISPNPIEGSKGTGPIEISDALEEDFRAKYDRGTMGTFLAEAYDATVALALAAQMAGSFEGTAIRDSLRSVTSGDGETIMSGIESIRKGLELAGQGSAINYDGESGSINWDSDGEVCSGKLTTWQYSDGEVSALSELQEANPGGAGDAACMN